MPSVCILSWGVRGGGRAKALLALAARCADGNLDTTVVTGTQGWSPERLATHHGIVPAGQWEAADWRADSPAAVVERVVAHHDPDVVIGFSNTLTTRVRQLDRPTVGYLRTSCVPGTDESWAPSTAVADEFSAELQGRDEPPCRAVYPVWYIDVPSTTPAIDDRPIDIMIHGRKARDVVGGFNPQYNILLANRFSYPELCQFYEQTKLFVFPRPERFEPLGLMPIEAAAHGCQLAVPSNSGVAELYPNHTFEHPTEAVELVLNQSPPLNQNPPESPTDPVTRIQRLAG